MTTFNVTVPIAVAYCVTVEAEDEETAKERATEDWPFDNNMQPRPGVRDPEKTGVKV